MTNKKNYMSFILCLYFITTFKVNTSEQSHAKRDMPFYIGKILPTPQKAEYFPEFLPLSNTAILPGENLKSDDLRVQLLEQRIKDRFGQTEVFTDVKDLSEKEVVFVLGEHELSRWIKVSEKPQGYVISMKKEKDRAFVFLKGNDHLGLSWAVSSVIQLITTREGKAVLAKAEIEDYPEVVNRGIWFGYKPKNKLFAFNFKFSHVLFCKAKTFMKTRAYNFWRNGATDIFRENLAETGNFLNPLGIQWFVGIHLIGGTPEQKFNCASEEDFNSFYSICAAIAKAGGDILIKLDDTRYPRNPAEKEVFKTAAEADLYLIKKLYKKLKTDFPNTKLMFIPVFYWGPAAPADYPESRDNYLRMIGNLPKDIRVTWNGPNVCSTKIAREDLNWEKRLVKRKPDVLIFRGGPHMFQYHYMTDVVDYSGSYFEGFFDEINTFYHCVGMPGNAVAAAQITNSFWNPDAFQPEESIKMIVEMLIGSGSFEYVDKLNKALSYFDQWALKPSPGAAKQAAIFKENLETLKSAYKACYELYPAIEPWSRFKYMVIRHEQLLTSLSKMDLREFSEAGDIIKKIAIKEIGYTTQKDILLSPYDFTGGHTPEYYNYRCERRLSTWIRGKKTAINKMQASFQLSDKSLAYLNELVISGQDDDAEKKCTIKICINSATVFEGANPFGRFGWNTRKFPLEKGILKEGMNALSIECLDESGIAHGPPFFMLNYAVLKNATVAAGADSH